MIDPRVLTNGRRAFFQRSAPALASFVFFGSRSSTSWAHPVHESLMEADVTSSGKKLECSLRVSPDDMEHALERFAKKEAGQKHYRIDKVSPEKLEADVTAYLRSRIELRCPNNYQPALIWVGLKRDLKAIWAFFEFNLPRPIEGYRMSQRCFLDIEPSQINTVNLRYGQKATTLLFRRSNEWREIRFPQDSK